MGLMRVTIGVFGAPEPGVTIPSLEIEKDIWLSDKKLKSRIGGLAGLEPLETICPGPKGHRAYIGYEDPRVSADILFDGESTIECGVHLAGSPEFYSAKIPFDVAQSLFFALEAGTDPRDFFKEKRIDYFVAEEDVRFAPPKFVKNSE
jgi:hypothetical protein